MLYLHGSIEHNSITLNHFSKDLDLLLKDKRKHIDLEICSEGGDIYSAIAIYNRIIHSNIPIHITVNAYCASAAVLIYAAGHERYAMPNSTFMVHELSSEISGNTLRMRRMTDQQLKEQMMYANLLAKNSKLPASRWIKLMNAETYFDEQIAVKYGLCQRIVK